MIELEKSQHKDMTRLSNESEIDKKINELRSKLNKVLESDIDTSEIISLSQELDKYIVFKQRILVEKTSEKQKRYLFDYTY